LWAPKWAQLTDGQNQGGLQGTTNTPMGFGGTLHRNSKQGAISKLYSNAGGKKRQEHPVGVKVQRNTWAVTRLLLKQWGEEGKSI